MYRSDDTGSRWSAFGTSLLEEDTSVRGIAADTAAAMTVVTTHRGLFRSTNGAKSWALVEGNLPVHLEARPLVRDPTEPNTLYAGFSLLPYAEVITPRRRLRVVERDPSDDKFVECAVAGKARVIISGDKDLLTIGSYRKIVIQSPAQFLVEHPRGR